MKIGIIGWGLVGKAVGIGMAHIGHYVKFCDIKKIENFDDESIKDVWPVQVNTISELDDCDVVFVCVPTPSNKDGSCDTSIVISVVEELMAWSFQGIIAIKSTVEPGTTRKLIDRFKTHKICFSPEFLRERFSVQDFIEEHDLCVVGTESDEIFDIVKKAHGNLPKNIVKLKPTEAEMVKYFNNVYNATLVTLANSFYELCRKLHIDYSHVKQALVLRNHIKDIYLDVNEDLRGFGGMCLPKDTKAISSMCDKLELNAVHFFSNILQQNLKFKTTILEGMRPENEKNHL